METLPGFYSVWALFGCVAVLFGLAATSLFRAADTPAGVETKRIAAMDGMRGFLALAVVFQHAAMYHRFLRDAAWTPPPSRVFALLGPVGVGLFFMITGFLFWSQLIRMRGRPAWTSLYIGRVFRIGPLYVAAIAVLLTVVAVSTGFRLHQGLSASFSQGLRLAGLGLLRMPSEINGYDSPSMLLAGVTWTLQWEWFFYLSLPVLALFARRKGMHLWFVLGAMAACQAYLHLVPHPYWRATSALGFVMLFLLGMLSASLREEGKLSRLPDFLASALLLGLLVFAFELQDPTSVWSQLALGLVLYLVISGCSLFGLLRTRAAIRLGDVSYGIYLLQGLILAGVLRWKVCRVRDFSSPVDHWLLCLLASVILVFVAMAAHVWIERPGILAGKRVARSLKSWA